MLKAVVKNLYRQKKEEKKMMVGYLELLFK